MKRKGRTAKSYPLSLFPAQRKFASQRAFNAGLTFSKYLQLLIEHDQSADLLPHVLAGRLGAKVLSVK